MKAIILHAVVPVRSLPEEGSEQQTQLLFAETCTIVEEQERWLKVVNDADGQTGWADRKMITPMDDEEYAAYLKTNREARVGFPLAYAVSEANQQTFPLTAGTRLPDYENGSFTVLGARFRIDEQMVLPHPTELTAERFMQTTRFFLNTPYLWGGKNALGMDCSGFTQVVMSLFGHELPRNASEQAEIGELVPFISEAQCGDLAFFNHAGGAITHVGILLDGEHIVHCSGRVKVERVDHHGIINQETGEYSHELVVIKRL